MGFTEQYLNKISHRTKATKYNENFTLNSVCSLSHEFGNQYNVWIQTTRSLSEIVGYRESMSSNAMATRGDNAYSMYSPAKGSRTDTVIRSMITN